jgi:hypothetical protein
VFGAWQLIKLLSRRRGDETGALTDLVAGAAR